MSEIVKNNPELKNKLSIDRIFEIYGDNGNKLAPSEIVLDLELNPKQAEDWTMQSLAKAKLDGKMTALVGGAFDMPQPNHDWFVRHCRLSLAERWLNRNGINTNELETDDLNYLLRSTIESNEIFLVVSIDTDSALDIRKSDDPAKGGVKRPIYPWEIRANRIASQSFASLSDPRIRYGLADLVIPGGPEYADTLLQQTKILADKGRNEYGLIDEYVVFDEHAADLENAKEYGFDPIILPMEYVYSRDCDGKRHSSSYFIKRAQGEI